MRQLANLTLVALGFDNPVPTLRALDICLQQARFGDALFLSNRADEFELADCRMLPVETPSLTLDALLPQLRTDHVLLVAWNGFMVQMLAWDDAFLNYDYVGPVDGPGELPGFALYSRSLLACLGQEQAGLTAAILSQQARLEQARGLRFAPPEVSVRFAFSQKYPEADTLGFQGTEHLWLFVDPQELGEFVVILDPGTVGSAGFLQLGKNYQALDRPAEARIVFERRLALFPQDGEARDLLQGLASPWGSPVVGRGVGRNEPCPCGSGKRYKHCCGVSSTTPAPGRPRGERGVSTDLLLRGGMQAHQTGNSTQAERLYRRILEQEPDHPGAKHYLGILAWQRGALSEGEQLVREALAASPHNPVYHNNLGLILQRQDRPEEALLAYETALQRNPDYGEAHNNAGLTLLAMNQVESATHHFSLAIARRPEFSEAHWNLGLAYLLQGDFQRGWEEYEWRLRCAALSAEGRPWPSGSHPWQGESLTGKTLFLRCLQGLGDILQMVRYLPPLLAEARQVMLQVGPELHALLQHNFPCLVLVSPGATVTAELYGDLMSLPRWLGEGVTHPIFAPSAYLVADSQRSVKFSGGPGEGRRLRIGYVWAGNPKHTNDHHRSCPRPLFEAWLAAFPQVSWISLQKGATQLPPGVWDLGPHLGDFADTAAAIMKLDLVIAVDTSVIHLAGALGKPAWLLLPFAPDWRWGLSSEQSAWYPSLRLFRQKREGDWSGLLTAVGQALREKFDL